jgi:hypothetical protein
MVCFSIFLTRGRAWRWPWVGCRGQLRILANYLRTCRAGSDLLSAIDALPHMASEEATYSINEVSACSAGMASARSTPNGMRGRRWGSV